MQQNEWNDAFATMNVLADKSIWQDGQEHTIRWMSERLKNQTGVLIADEVGMGKTRVVMAAILAVLKHGGSVAAVVPPGLLSQWKKEWDDFLKTLKKKEENESQYAPILLRSYNSMFNDPQLRFPLAQKNQGKWLLISHRFGVPRLQAGGSHSSPLRRYQLPILAAAIRLKKDSPRRNKFADFLRKDGWSSNCLDGACDSCGDRQQESCKFDLQVKKAAEFLAIHWRGEFRNLDDIRNPGAAKEFYKSSGLQMLRDLLGRIDLLVIDEAHKSRDTEEDQTQLGSLLRNIIHLNDGAKQTALTATPMELSATQWETIFNRIGESFPNKVIDDFAKTLAQANKYSDNPAKVRELIKASKAFSEVMQSFVTRRRRTKQAEFIQLVGEEPCKAHAHPHREWSPLIIEFNEVEEKWRPAIFGLEALGKVAKGLTVNNGDEQLSSLLRKLKIMDSRYAAAQISKAFYDPFKEDLDVSEIEKQKDDFDYIIEKINNYINENKTIDLFVLGKLKRILYWLNGIKNIGGLALASHPRVQKMADAIEALVWGRDGEFLEKILVFGTFVGPLRELRDVLNRRAVLRILDRKTGDGNASPLPSAEACLKDIENIWAEYERINASLTRITRLPKEQLIQIIKKAGKTYTNLQAKIGNHINKKFVDTLPGNAAVEADNSNVIDFLRSRLINDMIFKRVETLTSPDKIKMHALQVWAEFLESFLDSDDAEELVKIERLTDNMEERFAKAISVELADSSSHVGTFARLLYGGVNMETRHILKTQFNNINAFPMVLIAQSQVGREGLNLHKACKTVVQFHSEWNPGIIEQQIGRVDRINNLWENKAKKCKLLKDQLDCNTIYMIEPGLSEKENAEEYKGPKILVMPMVFKGTYDAFQYSVSKRRRETLNAHLFGELLNDEALERMPNDGDEWTKIRNELKRAAPDFSPK